MEQQTTSSSKARLIALYLPQFHPIPENDEWWGKGFTEWTNTAKAKPLFRGHYQPHVPADLGFYDLRLPEARIAQAELAKTYGIEAFCYYHYWFGGKRIIERPFNEVLESGKPDFPFCLCWANQTWTGIWHGAPNKILIEQTYPGMDDHRRHFDFLLRAFLDDRYIKVDGKPLFVIYNPRELPDSRKVTDFWRELAINAGLPGLYLVAEYRGSKYWNPQEAGFDAVYNLKFPSQGKWVPWSKPIQKIKNKYLELAHLPTIHQYKEILDEITFNRQDILDLNARYQLKDFDSYPCVIPNWDNTPRSGGNGVVLHESTPELFRTHLRDSLKVVHDLPSERRFVFIKSWNEWAEGNHLEPDLRFGHQYLQVVREELNNL
jgi:lipopolysaccharide biosynthesis protein